ncbi:MAG: M6 family metalloprotease domain-containing protein [Ignavibacteriales bacterium]|nr:M6 family metalloprotease domain-containing protein [Ignavibacteriales bacterium]
MKKYFLYLILSIIVSISFIHSVAIGSIPPHPRVQEMIKSGKISLPYHLANKDDALRRGINAPFSKNVIESLNSGDRIYDNVNEIRALVILVRFTDNQSTVNPVFFDSLAFGKSGSTMRKYFDEVSYGTIDIVTVNFPSSVGWINAPQNYSYYVNDQNGFGSYPQNAQKLTEDAVAAVNGIVDFSLYDNDHDSYVDALFIVHAGPGAEYTGRSTDIWSHAWSTSSPQYLDGVYVQRYSMEPEYWGTPGDMTCGVYAHEAGHAIFGLPDLYDYGHDSNGLGMWSLMASGSWGGYLGDSPSHPDAWSRYKMGLLTPVDLHQDSMNIEIPAVNNQAVVYRLWTEGNYQNEYFLVENRQSIGFDSYLPSAGLCVYHIDEYQVGNDNQWYPGYTSNGHYLVALEQADGNWDLEKNTSWGDNGDLYPGSTGNREFSFTSIPNSRSYSDKKTSVRIKNISNSGFIMTADFYVEVIPPDIRVSQRKIEGNISAGDTVRSSVTIKNIGEGELEFSIPQNSNINGLNSVSRGTTDIAGGGPDAFGYTWVSSRDSFGTNFNWIDISKVGTSVNIVPYGSSGYIPIGFNFPFYDSVFSRVSINASGFISFTMDGWWVPFFDGFPSEWNPPSIICILGADMSPGIAYYFSDTTNGMFIVQFNDWKRSFVDTSMYTMEIILNKDGRIKFQYLYMADGLNGRKGIQNQQRNIGLNISHNYSIPEQNLAIEIMTVPTWVSTLPSHGVIQSGDSAIVSFIFDPNIEVPSTKEAKTFIISNDPDEGAIPIDLIYVVRDEPNISISASEIDYGTTYYNEISEFELGVRNIGSKFLNIASLISGNNLINPDSSSYQIPPKSTRAIKLKIKPVEIGPFNSYIEIKSNDLIDSIIRLQVYGNVIHRPRIVFNPTPINLLLTRGDSSISQFVVSNQGLGTLEVSTSLEGREFEIGLTKYWWGNRKISYGNIYTFSSCQILHEFSSLIKIEMPQEVTFSIYRSETKTGKYTRIWQSTMYVNDTSQHYLSSGYINLNLMQNYYYYFSLGFSIDAIFHTASISSQPGFGKIEGKSLVSSYPTADELFLDIKSGIYVQKLTLRPAVISDINPRSSTILPGGSDTFKVVINAYANYGSYNTDIKINSNDPDYDEFFLPAFIDISGLNMSFDQGWNLFSVPFGNKNLTSSAISMDITQPAFEFSDGYSPEDTLKLGKGYWIKLDSSKAIILTGDVVASDTVGLKQGWNLIGSLSYDVTKLNVTAISPMKLNSDLIGYTNPTGYFNTTALIPGLGYWLKASCDGQLIMNSGVNNQTDMITQTNVNKLFDLESNFGKEYTNVAGLNFSDVLGNIRKIYFILEDEKLDLDQYEMPPCPPPPIFDVRYSDQKNISSFLHKDKLKINISGGKPPIQVKWYGWNIENDVYLEIESKKILLRNEGKILIENMVNDNIYLVRKNESLPRYYNLEQNYPNPFNPETKIKYQLPAQSRVVIKIYNLIGQEIVTLLNAVQEAGFKEIEFSMNYLGTSSGASGVYFYKMEAYPTLENTPSFVQVRKMIILK